MELKQIEINKIKPNPFQPREKFDQEELQELADNIKQHGMIEPIVITTKGMIVAGERRWRANKLAKQDKVWAIVKDYKNDSDIKRDSLVENEMRENLSNEEFKSFVFSLAKSLGNPYYNKGFVNPLEVSKYILGTSKDVSQSPMCRKLQDFFKIQQSASAKVKKLFEEEKIDRRTATTIASISDKKTQDELAELAKHKSTHEIRQEVVRHNFEQQAIQAREKAKNETDEEKKIKSEMSIVSKFSNKINSINDSINFFSQHLISNRQTLSKFQHKSRMCMLDSLKPLRRDLEKLLHLVTKLMEVLAK